MADEPKTQEPEKEVYTLEEIAKYRPMTIASELFEDYVKTKDKSQLEETITTFYEKGLGVKNKRDIGDAVKSIIDVPQALKGFIDNFDGRYEEALHSQKLKDLRQFYDSAFKEYYNEGVLPEVDEVFNSEETYKSIIDKYNDAVLDTKKANISDEDKEKAKKTVKALSRVVDPLKAFEEAELDKLRAPIKKKALKKRLNAAYEKKEEKQAA